MLSQLLSQEELNFPLNHSVPFHFLHEVLPGFPIMPQRKDLGAEAKGWREN